MIETDLAQNKICLLLNASCLAQTTVYGRSSTIVALEKLHRVTQVGLLHHQVLVHSSIPIPGVALVSAQLPACQCASSIEVGHSWSQLGSLLAQLRPAGPRPLDRRPPLLVQEPAHCLERRALSNLI